MNKRGIEAVIATVLLIVITIALVAAVIAFVVPWIQKNMSQTQACYNAKLEIKEACYLTSNNNVSVRIARGVGIDNVTLSSIVIGVSTATETKTFPQSDLLAQLEEKTYYLLGTPGMMPTSVKIAAIVKDGTTTKQCDYGPAMALVPCA